MKIRTVDLINVCRKHTRKLGNIQVDDLIGNMLKLFSKCFLLKYGGAYLYCYLRRSHKMH